MEKLDYSESQASNLLYSGGLQIYTTQDPDLQAIVDEEINNPDNYSAAKYSVEYRLSVTHADGSTCLLYTSLSFIIMHLMLYSLFLLNGLSFIDFAHNSIV